ncbi:MAG TPA: SusC/RagA family TonB-linked outer membrane protein [Phnomibacter sp.]|nr:SusC/RagA family TonB-linked outer membrane protein [Phnomibacter sp.]
MSKTFKALVAICFALVTTFAFGQEKTVSGKVTDAKDNSNLAGVTVSNQRSSARTQTDANGKYTIKAKPGDEIRFTFVGFGTISATVGQSASLDISMKAAASDLGDVVVTALGIKRQKRGLGYATQEVKGAEIAETQRENFINSLQGRVAGATVNSTSGAPGASTQIVLRGFNSLTGNNSPLFIVDGLPVNNDAFSTAILSGASTAANDRANRGNDYSNRGIDINPDDIETVTILKGPEATALYGIEAGSGAIVITTKKGTQGKMKVSYDNSFRLEHLTRFPDVQTKYSTGTNGVYDSTVRTRFGPAWPASTRLYDNVEAFFQNGYSQKHSLSAEGGTRKMTYRANATFQDQTGVIPETRFTRFAPRVTLVNNFTKQFSMTNSLAYTHTKNIKANRGAGGFMTNLLLWPNNNDVTYWQDEDLKRVKVVDDPAFAEVDNPFWDVNRNKNEDVNDRYFYNLTLSYDPLKWLNITGRGGVDYYNQWGQYSYSPQSNPYYSVKGYMEYYSLMYRGLSGNLVATAKNTFGDFKTTVRVGTALDEYRRETWSERSEDILEWVQDFQAATKPAKRFNSRQTGRDTLQIKRLQGFFGELGVSYKDVVYVSATGRNDFTSTLSKDYNSFFYPSVSTSIILSDMLFPDSRTVTFAKLRGSFAETAKDIQPYADQSVYTPQLTSGGGMLYDFTNNNPYIKPERQQTFEVGAEAKFWGDRLGIEATYYHTENSNQIVSGYRLSYGTGFVLNAGNVSSTRNEGVEIVLNAMPVKMKNFNWRTTLNFNRMWNEVTGMIGNITEFYNSDSWIGNYRNGIVLHEPTTTLTGQTYLKNNNGEILVDPTTGLPILDGTYRVIADRMPTFTLGWQNSFTYKNWQLSFLLDFRVGGDILNGNELYWYSQGLSKKTLDRETARVFDGVLRDGRENSTNPTKNNIAITPYFFQDFYNLRAVASDFVEKDVNWAWLRDITLRYNFTAQAMAKSKWFSRASIFATCTDPMILTNYSGLSPNSNGNTPATSGVGSFGIDYGSIPNPLGFNVGVTVGFKN